MRIKKTTNILGQPVQAPQEVSSRSTGSEKSGSGKSASQTSDRVQLSRGYQEVAQVTKSITAENEIRTDEVERLRDAIESNAYAVEPEKVADKMLDEML